MARLFPRVQAVVRFLWDAHNCEEAREEEELVVSTPYIEHWNDLIDLWYLGMQVSLYLKLEVSTGPGYCIILNA